jgi:DNA-binding NarL/FixJ family response regulator
MRDMKHINKGNETGKPKRVFLVDQFAIVRLAVVEWFNRTPDLVVCGATDTAASALKAIRWLKPDIVVTEILIQQDFKFIETLHARHPRLPILVFSFRDEAWYAPRALEAGADGYLLKGISVDGFVAAIRRTLEGRVVLSPDMRYKLLAKCVRHRPLSALTRIAGRLHYARGPGRRTSDKARMPRPAPNVSRKCHSKSRHPA